MHLASNTTEEQPTPRTPSSLKSSSWHSDKVRTSCSLSLLIATILEASVVAAAAAAAAVAVHAVAGSVRSCLARVLMSAGSTARWVQRLGKTSSTNANCALVCDGGSVDGGFEGEEDEAGDAVAPSDAEAEAAEVSERLVACAASSSCLRCALIFLSCDGDRKTSVSSFSSSPALFVTPKKGEKEEEEVK